MFSLVCLAPRVPRMEVQHRELQTRVPSAAWLCRHLSFAACAGTLRTTLQFKMAAVVCRVQRCCTWHLSLVGRAQKIAVEGCVQRCWPCHFKLEHLCHPTISSSVISFSSCLQSFPASGSFPMSQFFISGEGCEQEHPLRCSCLENPRDGGAWWAAVYGVAQSGTTEVT